MRIKLTNPDLLDKVIEKLDDQFSLGPFGDDFIEYCVPRIKERIAKGETILLTTEIQATRYGQFQIVQYECLEEMYTDEQFLSPSYDDTR